MTVVDFGRERAATAALAAAMLVAPLPVTAQDSATTTPSPSRPIDFRLPPADDGRTPGVQGPADNGLPPVAPGERRGPPTPAPAPTPAPTPTQPVAPPRVTPTQPATTTEPAPARREAPAAAPRASAAPDTRAEAQPATTDSPALPPLDTAAPAAPDAASAAPADADAEPAVPVPQEAPSGTPPWAWILAVLAAAGAGFWYWRRRAAVAGPAPDEVETAAPRGAAPPAPPRPAAPALPPKPAPRPPAAPRPAPASGVRAPTVPAVPRPASALVTRPAGEQRAIIGMALDIRSIRFAPDHVAVGFALNLLNQGTAAATGLMVRIALNQGSAMPEAVLGRFFDGAGGSILRDDMMLNPGAGEQLSSEVMLPRAAIEPLMIGGKPMLVPVIAFDVTYHWDGEGEAFGQNAGSFVLGRETGAGGDKLAPLPLDRASYSVDHPGARSTAMRRAQ